MTSFFITGTDTEVGKTLITGAIIYQLQEQGYSVCGFKPVVAGLVSAEQGWMNEDLETLLTISNRNKSPADALTDEQICPYTLHSAAAPHLVAHEEGIVLDPEIMRSAFVKLLDQHHIVVVEGAGGFLVPISESVTLGDFAELLNLPVILVVDIRLGCINHALLTAASIDQHKLRLVGWVANFTAPPGPYSEENIQTLQSMLWHQYQAKCLGVIPYQPTLKTPYSIDDIEQVAHFLTIDSLLVQSE